MRRSNNIIEIRKSKNKNNETKYYYILLFQYIYIYNFIKNFNIHLFTLLIHEEECDTAMNNYTLYYMISFAYQDIYDLCFFFKSLSIFLPTRQLLYNMTILFYVYISNR